MNVKFQRGWIIPPRSPSARDCVVTGTEAKRVILNAVKDLVCSFATLRSAFG